jgi:hypothetical protein
MAPIKITSIQADNQEFIIEGITQYLGSQLGMPTEITHHIPWQERERLLDSGQIQLFFRRDRPPGEQV